MLRQGHTVSGEILSRELGVSRVSIWKHIKDLKERGYDIVASPKGYDLGSSPDALFPWEFPDREEKIHYFPNVDSTMDIAREMAVKGCPGFTVIIAGQQEKGRGRLKRIWHSQQGGLYFTVVLRPDIPLILSHRVSFLASVTLAETLRGLFKIDAKVKWPNDILVNEKKISGMLSEMEAETDRVKYINLGLGINVNNDPKVFEPSSTSIAEINGRPVMRKEILEEFLNQFEAGMNTDHLNNAVNNWKKYTVTLNRHVKIVTNNKTSEGMARDIDENGALILELSDGSMQKIIYGDCFHV